ncbi:MAG TPA: hypothetical protein VD994_09505 [Prosthecobacter sp.]|nr:hypothetical protein [Prosthecobacter sp.]
MKPEPWMHDGGWRRLPMRRWHQRVIARLYDIWLIASGQQTLHRAWQTGYDQGCQSVYRQMRSRALEPRPWVPLSVEGLVGNGSAPSTQRRS